MIKFIDIQTGNVFDGSGQYVHWFDNKLSKGLIYDKQFVIITDAKKVEIRIDSPVFYLVDNHKIGYWKDQQGRDINKTVNGKSYLDLDVLKTNEIHHPAYPGAEYNGFYVYTFNILADGKIAGSILDKFYINGEEFQIGANFFDEDEFLKINLSNFGVELNEKVQNAVYEKNIDEQKSDFVLLNRKFKELLNEYINIIANKGSYKSLVNALNWFEYGDLVQIYEYWRNFEPNKEYLQQHELSQYIANKSEIELSNSIKSTYIGISSALNKIKMDNGRIVYDEHYIYDPNVELQLLNEPNPELENVVSIWSKEVMSLKMTLLGMFFAKYFMPIHLDLLHSIIENVIYTDTIKFIGAQTLKRFDSIDCLNTFECTVNTENYLDNVTTYTNLNTLFGYVNESNLNIEDKNTKTLGVDTEFSDLLGTDDDKSKAYSLQRYQGIGAIIPFNCVFKDLTDNDLITHAEINLYRNGQLIISKEDNRLVIKNQTLNFNILITEIGSYKAQLKFRKNDGSFYIKTVDFNVYDTNYVDLKMYKLTPKDNIELIDIKNWISDDNTDVIKLRNVSDYVINPIFNGYENNNIYTQFISASHKNIENTVHTNQIIIIQVPIEGKTESQIKTLVSTIYIKNKAGEEFNLFDAFYAKRCMQDVTWTHMDRSTQPPIMIDDEDWIASFVKPDKRYIIGVCRTFNTNSDNNAKYKLSTLPKGVKGWIRDAFIPYFYELKEFGVTSFADDVLNNRTKEDLFRIRIAENTYELNQTDVVCFLPNLRCYKSPEDFMWKFNNVSTNLEITPLPYAHITKEDNKQIQIGPNKMPLTILQPLFGRYDFRILPDKGYYDLTFNYKLSNIGKKQTKTIKSQFIIK